MRLILLLILWMLTPVAFYGATPLESARRAQAMLGPEVWSRIVRIETPGGRDDSPGVVEALVFEQGGILWFYTATEGTQSLSLYWNRLSADKGDLGPLLQAINPGFVRFRILPDADEVVGWNPDAPLPNGCFIECLAALRERVLRGERIEAPRLLSCYTDTAKGLRGHTVLTYETPEGFCLLDPATSPRPRVVPLGWRRDPLALAGAVMDGARVLKARWVLVDRISLPLVAKAGAPTRWANATTAQIMQ